MSKPISWAKSWHAGVKLSAVALGDGTEIDRLGTLTVKLTLGILMEVPMVGSPVDKDGMLIEGRLAEILGVEIVGRPVEMDGRMIEVAGRLRVTLERLTETLGRLTVMLGTLADRLGRLIDVLRLGMTTCDVDRLVGKTMLERLLGRTTLGRLVDRTTLGRLTDTLGRVIDDVLTLGTTIREVDTLVGTTMLERLVERTTLGRLAEMLVRAIDEVLTLGTTIRELDRLVGRTTLGTDRVTLVVGNVGRAVMILACILYTNIETYC